MPGTDKKKDKTFLNFIFLGDLNNMYARDRQNKDKTFLIFIFLGLKNRNTTTFFFQLLLIIPQPAWGLIGLLSGHDPVMVML